MKKIIFVSLFILFLFFIKSPQVVRAQINDLPALKRLYEANLKKTATQSGTGVVKDRTTLNSQRASAAAERKLARTDNLETLKLRACEARQSAITKRSEQIVKRATNQLDVFAKIAQRVQEFYQSKLIPQGKVVANYDSLVADIASSGAAIMPLLAEAEASAAGFSCDKDHPADQVKTFNEDMRAVISGLETYRKSVRNLIVAVRGAAGSLNSATSSALPL